MVSGQRRIARRVIIGLVTVTSLLVLSGCAWFASEVEKFDQAFNGISATMTTYTQDGQMIDQVHGTSFRVSRDEKFDSTNADGTSNEDSSVLLISLGDSHISHVGSSMVLAEDGLVDVSAQLPATVSFENTERGTPWLNDLIERHRNLWQGKGKTMLIRSQDGNPIGIWAGDNVEIMSTDVPKSTWFRIDGKFLFVYRSDYTIYDNDLIS